MRLGILADIHEDTEALAAALALLGREGVDRLVVLGDLFFAGRRVAETVDLLAGAGACGVWGNHDLGLCYQPDPHLCAQYPRRVFDFLGTVGPRVELEGCLFTHGLPHWDATDPAAYYLEPRPETEEGRAGSFGASTQRVSFVGHFHRWLAATPEGLLGWKGNEEIVLDPGRRYLVVVAAVCEGWCAIYDTVSGRLVPHRLPVRDTPTGDGER